MTVTTHYSVTCNGVPEGFDAGCGIRGAHGPHGPLPVPAPGTAPMTRRAHAIASIHALADYLAEHPEHPTPDKITLEQGESPRTEVDEQTRIRAITGWTDANGGRLSDGRYCLMGTVTLMDGNAAGVHVIYQRFAHYDIPRNGA